MLRTASTWVALLGLAACGSGRATSPSGTAMSFALPSNTGDLVTVPLTSSKRSVLDFFGPTCEPCARELPALVARRGEIEQHGGKLVLIAVLADGESSADAERALAKWGVRSNFLVDRAGVSLREAGVKSLPATLIVDASGVVVWRAPDGAQDADVLHALE